MHSTTGKSPAQVLFGRQLRSRLDYLNPSCVSPLDLQLSERVIDQQLLQSKYYHGNRSVNFEIGETVLIKTFTKQTQTWTKGIIMQKIGNSLYLIKIDKYDKLLKKHKNQIIKYKGERIVCDGKTESAHSKTVNESSGMEKQASSQIVSFPALWTSQAVTAQPAPASQTAPLVAQVTPHPAPAPVAAETSRPAPPTTEEAPYPSTEGTPHPAPLTAEEAPQSAAEETPHAALPETEEAHTHTELDVTSPSHVQSNADEDESVGLLRRITRARPRVDYRKYF